MTFFPNAQRPPNRDVSAGGKPNLDRTFRRASRDACGLRGPSRTGGVGNLAGAPSGAIPTQHAAAPCRAPSLSVAPLAGGPGLPPPCSKLPLSAQSGEGALSRFFGGGAAARKRRETSVPKARKWCGARRVAVAWTPVPWGAGCNRGTPRHLQSSVPGCRPASGLGRDGGALQHDMRVSPPGASRRTLLV